MAITHTIVEPRRACATRSVSLLLGALLLSPHAALAQVVAPPTQASRHFERGYALAQEGSLEEAISEFRQAHALQPHPSVLYNLGQAYAASGRAVEAVETLRRFLNEAPETDSERRKQAVALMEYQEQRIGTLALRVEPPGAVVSVDGVTVGTAPLSTPVRLTAGSHALVIEVSGRESHLESIRITAKRELALSRTLNPRPSQAAAPSPLDLERDRELQLLRDERRQQRSVQRSSAIVLAGVGLSAVTGAGVVYLVNQGAWSAWRRDSERLASAAGSPSGASVRDFETVLARENTLRNRDAWGLGLAVFGGVVGATSAALWLTLPSAKASGLSVTVGSAPRLNFKGSF